MANQVAGGTRETDSGPQRARFNISQVSSRAREIAERTLGPESLNTIDEEETTEVIEKSLIAKRAKIAEIAGNLGR